MTTKQLKQIISNLPDDAIVLVEAPEISDTQHIDVVYHSDGRIHVIISSLE